MSGDGDGGQRELAGIYGNGVGGRREFAGMMAGSSGSFGNGREWRREVTGIGGRWRGVSGIRQLVMAWDLSRGDEVSLSVFDKG